MHKNAMSNPLGQLLAPPLSLQDLTIPEPMTGKALDCCPQQEIQGSEAQWLQASKLVSRYFESFDEKSTEMYGVVCNMNKVRLFILFHSAFMSCHILPMSCSASDGRGQRIKV